MFELNSLIAQDAGSLCVNNIVVWGAALILKYIEFALVFRYRLCYVSVLHIYTFDIGCKTVEKSEQQDVRLLCQTVEKSEQLGVTLLGQTVEKSEQQDVRLLCQTVEKSEQLGVTLLGQTVEKSEQLGVKLLCQTLTPKYHTLLV